MKKDLKLLLATTLIAALMGGVPTVLHWRMQQEVQALLSRPPAPATRVLRQALASATEVRIHVQTGDSYTPEYFASRAAVASRLGKPTFIWRGQEMKDLIASLHAERGGQSAWQSYDNSQPPPNSIEIATALEFFAGDQWIADIRVGETYGLRWYSPPVYKADAPLMWESMRYLHSLGAYKANRGELSR
jgi:hypothetical protein